MRLAAAPKGSRDSENLDSKLASKVAARNSAAFIIAWLIP